MTVFAGKRSLASFSTLPPEKSSQRASRRFHVFRCCATVGPDYHQSHYLNILPLSISNLAMTYCGATGTLPEITKM